MASAVTVADALDSVMQSFQDLIPIAQSCNERNAPDVVFERGPWFKVFSGIGKAAGDLQRQGSLLSFDDGASGSEDGALILDSVANYANVSSNLFDIMIGKVTTSTSVFVQPQGRQAFRRLDDYDNEFFSELVRRTPSEKADLSDLAHEIEDEERKAIQAYSTPNTEVAIELAPEPDFKDLAAQ